MKREVDLNEISDGKLYGVNDMVRADCGDCEGCSACCQGMGTSILLDPLDIHRLTVNLGLSFEQLLQDKIELNVADGIILPNLKMGGSGERCGFLSGEGRCTIHSFRPGICRIFPLGRVYEGHSFSYFLQVRECKKENRSKVKVKKWIDTPDYKRNERFIISWHDFVLERQEEVKNGADAKAVSMELLKRFYMTPYEEEFYEDFFQRLRRPI